MVRVAVVITIIYMLSMQNVGAQSAIPRSWCSDITNLSPQFEQDCMEEKICRDQKLGWNECSRNIQWCDDYNRTIGRIAGFASSGIKNFKNYADIESEPHTASVLLALPPGSAEQLFYNIVRQYKTILARTRDSYYQAYIVRECLRGRLIYLDVEAPSVFSDYKPPDFP